MKNILKKILNKKKVAKKSKIAKKVVRVKSKNKSKSSKVKKSIKDVKSKKLNNFKFPFLSLYLLSLKLFFDLINKTISK